MLRNLGYTLALIACVQILGGHWAALQVVAWAGMLVDHSTRGESFSAALGKTFDGQHPCELCHKVKMGQAEEQNSQKQAQLKQSLKLEFPLCPRMHVIAPSPRIVKSCISLEDMSYASISIVPLHPPPRSSGVV